MTRYKTWEQECLPALRLQGDGSVALCVLWNLLDTVTHRLPPELSDLGVIGNLRTPLGLSWLLRGLWNLSKVQKLILWGSDLTGSGEALLELWKKGLTADHRVPGFEWQIDQLIPAEAIEQLRGEVQILDCRKRDLVSIVPDLTWSGGSSVREQRTFPPVPVPELQFWPSRSSGIHIEASDIAQAWLGALQVVLHCGSPRATRKTEKIAHFFDFTVSFPVSEQEELHSCFDFSTADLERYASQVLSPERPEGVDYWYGERMQNWRGHNQLEEVINRLTKAPDTKRATIAILEAPDLETLEDAPCFTSATFSVADGVVNGSYVFRSQDMYAGWPSNAYAILRVHRFVAGRLGYGLGRATFHSQNSQVYERHWEVALGKLRIFGASLERPAEFLRFKNDAAGNFVFAITQSRTVSCTYVSVNNDQILWEVEHREPQGLIAWIVASMPWLSGQHIRYLGVQEEKLRRALKSGEEYIQG